MSNILEQGYSYEYLNTNDYENEILKCLVKDKSAVLLDAGALMIRYSNIDVAKNWLASEIRNDIEAAVFFQ